MPLPREAAFRLAIRRPPGVPAQAVMAPQPRAGWTPHDLPDGLRPAAALLLLYPADDEWCLPLTERAGTLRRHTGQVSLPGGALDAGESIEAAALREAEEEIGAAPHLIRVIGSLTPLHIPVSGYLLHPVLGITDTRPAFRPNASEVARLLDVPVPALRHPGAVCVERRTSPVNGSEHETTVPCYAIGDVRVWGATAMVLAEFLALVEAAHRLDQAGVLDETGAPPP